MESAIALTQGLPHLSDAYLDVLVPTMPDYKGSSLHLAMNRGRKDIHLFPLVYLTDVQSMGTPANTAETSSEGQLVQVEANQIDGEVKKEGNTKRHSKQLRRLRCRLKSCAALNTEIPVLERTCIGCLNPSLESEPTNSNGYPFVPETQVEDLCREGSGDVKPAIDKPQDNVDWEEETFGGEDSRVDDPFKEATISETTSYPLKVFLQPSQVAKILDVVGDVLLTLGFGVGLYVLCSIFHWL
ncbi:hypothetical protein M422DRAFT_32211 [Sphaerobolus stellatus SS14]|uniref:Uncharacterized protein n=1 Tax=Sphaerobolus stellatus (strain SS14) TaxID=990650 RepID=A0A0C9VGK0_SPHS4|nr:hypothetical protein M422DRAFT_32211 [Sphaerobolus stellatus SS14]